MTQDWLAQSSELWPIEKITPYARDLPPLVPSI
jgi:hypothetical protein